MNAGPFLMPHADLADPAEGVVLAEVVTAPPQRSQTTEELSDTFDPPLATAVPASAWPMRAVSWTYHSTALFLHGSFGVFSMIAGLSVLASIPILNLLSLGYLLEVSGRLARTGKISNALVGIHKASRVGSIVFCAWLAMLPSRFLAGFWYDAYLLNPGSSEERQLRIATITLIAFSAVYIFWAWVRGGRFRDFLWPAPIRFFKTFFSGKLWKDAANGYWDFVASLRLPYYFSLGFRGFVGTAIWLALPILLFIGGAKSYAPLAGFFNVAAFLTMGLALIYLPFAQAHFAAENRFRAMFDVVAVRDHFRRAPIFFWIALLFTVALALPLYLAKIEYIPRELLFLPGILFITFAFPARVLTGWAMGYASRRAKPRFFLFRWASRLAMIPIALVYVIVLYFSQFTSWTGVYSLFEQHAFLVPAPFLSN